MWLGSPTATLLSVRRIGCVFERRVMRIAWMGTAVLLLGSLAAAAEEGAEKKAHRRFVVEGFGGLSGLGSSPTISTSSADIDLGSTPTFGIGVGYNVSPRI